MRLGLFMMPLHPPGRRPAETLAEVKASGCRYIYTHLPRLLGAGAAGFLKAR